MPIFFPDNQKRSDRLMQLINQVNISQKTSSDEYTTIKGTEDSLLVSFKPLMQKQNVESLEEFVAYIKSQMPADAQEEYQKVFDATKGFRDTNSNAVTIACGLLFAAAIKSESTVDMSIYMKAVAAMISLICHAKGVNIIVTKDRDEGLTMLKDMRIPLKGVLSHLKIATTYGDVFSITSTVAKVCTWLGFHAEILVTIGQIIIESNQRDELIKNIHEGLVDRLSVYYFGEQLRITTQNTVALKSFVESVTKYGLDNPIVISTAQDIAKEIQESLGKVTLDGVLNKLANLDTGAFMNDDLSPEEQKAKVKEEIAQFEQEAANA